METVAERRERLLRHIHAAILLKAYQEHWPKGELLAAIDAYVMSQNGDGGNVISDIPAKIRLALSHVGIRETTC
jgi:hypothetical protein